jgi:hypothetical protein
MNEPPDSDEEYREPASEDNNPGSTVTWDHRFERIDRVPTRASQNRRNSVLEVDASVHDLHTVHLGCDESTWIECCRQERIRAPGEKKLMWVQDRLQKGMTASCVESGYSHSLAPEDATLQNSPSAPMDSFSINRITVGKGMGDMYHASRARNIHRSSDRAPEIVATGSMFS